MMTRSLFLLLGLLATTAQAIHLPLTRPAAGGQFAFAADGATPVDPDDSTEHTERWKCDAHGWVRAPDLSPDTVIPAQARIVMNGTECHWMTQGQIGLRLKERALIKMRAKNVELPVFPDQNDTAGMRVFPDNDARRELFSVNPTWGYMAPPNDAQNEYYRAMANHSLWDVRGVERIVFDVGHPMSGFPPSSASELIDVVYEFAVHVPNTNFPPVEAYGTSGRSFSWSLRRGEVNDYTEVETLFEYYFLARVNDTSVFELPIGRTAFVPDPDVTSLDNGIVDEWPKIVSLTAPRTRDENQGVVPSCDAGNLAEFKLIIDKSPGPAVQGSNMTLKFTLERSGNGSEVPDALEVRGQHATRSYTWASSQVESEEEYNLLVGRNGEILSHMLMVRNEASLEKERQMRELQDGGLFSTGPRNSQYVFNVTNDSVSDTYNFEIDFPIEYNAMPNFEKTFETLGNNLTLTLYTKFLCQTEEEESQGPYRRYMGLPEEVVDLDEWDEYELPRQRATTRSRTSYMLAQRGQFPIKIVSSAPTHWSAPTHYLDPEARSPVIMKNASPRLVEFPPLGTTQPEEVVEKCRYGCRRKSKLCPHSACGGKDMHAAKIWQRKEAVEANRKEAKGV